MGPFFNTTDTQNMTDGHDLFFTTTDAQSTTDGYLPFFNTTVNQSSPDGLDFGLTNGQRLARVILLPILIIIGLVGNVLVCVAVWKAPKLQKVVNYFIVSLAVADLLVCSIVLPLAIHQEFNGLIWGLEQWVCRLWMTLDVLLCTSSIWNLCLVSTDRYLAVAKPNQYAKWRTPRNAGISITVVWILALTVALMLHFNSTELGEGAPCAVTSSPVITVLGPLFTFYIPAIIILILYWRIYIKVRQFQIRRRPSTMSSVAKLSSTDTSMKQNAVSPSPGLSRNNSFNTSDANKIDRSTDDLSRNGTLRNSKKRSRRPLQRANAVSGRRERKYAIVLAIIVLTFIGCWLPFFIVYLMQLTHPNLPFRVFNAFTWLGWCNSLINPIMYTIFNKDFRKAFKMILTCKLFRLRRDLSVSK